MSNHDDDILAEAAKILAEAEKAIESERPDSMADEFSRLEQAMWEHIGNTAEDHMMFLLQLVPKDKHQDTISQAEGRLIKGNPNVVTGEEPDLLLSITPLAQGGDLYDMLDDQYLAAHVATLDTEGMLVRMAGTATAVDVTPEVKREVIVTTMLVGDAIYIATRFLDDNSVQHSTIHATEYKQGESKMIDSVLMFYMAPKAMRQMRPEVFDALYQDLTDKRVRNGEEVFPTAQANNSPKEDNSNE